MSIEVLPSRLVELDFVVDGAFEAERVDALAEEGGVRASGVMRYRQRAEQNKERKWTKKRERERKRRS